MNKKTKKTIRNAAIPVAIALYLLYTYLIAAHTPLNSDMANMVLEAQEILEGNIFLKGRVFTGLTFLTTDLPYFVLGCLLNSNGVQSYYIAITLMFAAAAFAGIPLVMGKKGQKNRLLYIIFYMCLAALPTAYCMNFSRVHTGCIPWIFLGIYYLVRISESDITEKKKSCLLPTMFFTLSAMGDTLAVLIIILPLLVVSFFNMFRTVLSSVKPKLYDAYMFFTAVASVILSQLLNAIYLKIGGTDLNGGILNRRFIDVSELQNKIVLLIKGFLMIFGADFQNQPMGSLSTFFYVIWGFILVTGLFIVVLTVIRYFTGKECDYVNLFLSLGLLFICIIYVLTNFSVDLNSTRYYNYAVFYLGIIIVRELMHYSGKFEHNMKLEQIVIVLMCPVLIFSRMYPEVKKGDIFEEYADKEIIALADTLKENGLKNGYAAFWDSSVVSVYSNNEVTVRHLDSERMERYYWFCNLNWYDEPANFVISSPAGLTHNQIFLTFGKPANIIASGKYMIYVYDFDISDHVQPWWKIEPGVNTFEIADTYYVSDFERNQDGCFESTDTVGHLLMGPGKILPKGNYSITFNYHYNGDLADGTELAVAYINSNMGYFADMRETPMYAGETSVTIENVTIGDECKDFETVVHSRHGIPGIVIDSVEINMLG